MLGTVAHLHDIQRVQTFVLLTAMCHARGDFRNSAALAFELAGTEGGDLKFPVEKKGRNGICSL